METQGQKQRRFATAAARLILYIDSQGYQCSINEVKRSNEQAEINAIGPTGRERVAQAVRALGFGVLADAILDNGKAKGIRHSVHQLSLAVDLNLFKDGVYLEGTEDHRCFGEWWEKQGEGHRWGGRWGDGNHYSIEFNGVK